ncbi:hypothetical protein M378DRAFT_181464 [Amanita muscaria Koide BX008]|uniref:Uncharacterized protein n=1 Tax=Amanita muscaria (strain Koide BX008) TaxID=946122 RepID=A0A0C2WP18_AMAMK|nr:hypothetical protein M378DRAFT_181464 [Amanita muscaria Koide BX008]
MRQKTSRKTFRETHGCGGRNVWKPPNPVIQNVEQSLKDEAIQMKSARLEEEMMLKLTHLCPQDSPAVENATDTGCDALRGMSAGGNRSSTRGGSISERANFDVMAASIPSPQACQHNSLVIRGVLGYSDEIGLVSTDGHSTRYTP